MQFEFPWALGPADGRYVVRDAADGATTHVLLLATLGAPQRRRLRERRGRAAAPEPDPAPVTTTRATVIEAEPIDAKDAGSWLAAADATTVATALGPLARAVRAHRIASSDPAVHEPGLSHALVTRAGYGVGEQVAEGRWTDARELPPAHPSGRRRHAVLRPQERLAALLGGRTQTLACEELALRARHDLDRGLLREGALQLRVALDAALAELPGERDTVGSQGLSERIAGLRDAHPPVDALADAALGGVLPPEAQQVLETALGQLEAALRARAAVISNARLEP